MRDVNDLNDMIIKHTPRRSRRSLFGEEESAQYLLGDGGPLLDQNIGMDDLDPAFPDYNVAGLFNAYFRDGDSEDNTLDYWTIENGDGTLTVEDCAESPGGVCLVYTATGEISTASYLISAAVPIGPGVDQGIIMVGGNTLDSDVYARASITWYNEEGEVITTSYGQKKSLGRKKTLWLKIPRSNAAQSASFASVKIAFSATTAGVVVIQGVQLFPLLPASEVADDTPDTGDGTVYGPGKMWMYEDFEPAGGTLDGPDVIGVAEDGSSTYSEGTTFWDMNLPDGCDVPGRHLIAWVAAEPYEDLYTAMTTAGWTKMIATAGTTFFYKRLGGVDGTDPTGYAATGAVEAIQVDDYLSFTPTVNWQCVLVAGLYDEGAANPGLWHSSGMSHANADPPSVSEPSWSDLDTLSLAAIRAEAAITDGPSGYTAIGRLTTTAGSYTLGTSFEYKQIASGYGTEDPSTYTTTDDMSGTYDSCWTILVRCGTYSGSVETGLGVLPDGALNDAPWEGLTQWVTMGLAEDGEIVSGAARFAVADGDSEQQGSKQVGTEYDELDAVVEAFPQGPHNQPHIALLKVRWSGPDAGRSGTLYYQWFGSTTEGQPHACTVELAFTAAQTTLVVNNGTPVVIPEFEDDTDYWMMVDFADGVTCRAKVWKTTEYMSATWQASAAVDAGSYLQSAIFLYSEQAPTGDDQYIEVEEIWIQYPSVGGRAYIGIADGVNASYYSPLQWSAGGPKVYLDGFLTTLASYDASDWSFTFDRVPSWGTKIEVEV